MLNWSESTFKYWTVSRVVLISYNSIFLNPHFRDAIPLCLFVCFLAFMVSDEKSILILICGFCKWFVFFSLTAFRIFSLCLVFRSLSIIYLGMVCFLEFILLVVLTDWICGLVLIHSLLIHIVPLFSLFSSAGPITGT